MKIVWSPLAVEQARDIAAYIALDKPSAAKSWASEMFSCVDKLIDFPEIGRVVPEIRRHDIREIIHGSHRVIYKLSGSQIDILIVKSYRQKFSTKEIKTP